jgi:hypothetical protein
LGGAKGGGDAARQTESSPDSLVWAIVAVFVFGIGSTIGLIAVMKNYNLNEGLVNAFALMSFMVMIAVEAIFIWLLLSQKREERKALDAARSRGQETRELDAAHMHALPEPLPSVTEHTTRAFEPIYRERKMKSGELN